MPLPRPLSLLPPFPLPAASRGTNQTCVVAQEVALSYAPAFWVICFYLLFLKKKKEKGFPIASSLSTP